MYKPRSKRAQTIRATIVYTVMTTLVLVGVAVATFYLLGYRFDTKDQTISQGGLIQLETRPGGARIAIDERAISGRTPTQHDVSAGAHTVRMTRDGYRPWQKTVTVDPGSVHWLSYALLVPQKLEQTPLKKFANVDAALSTPEADRLAVLQDETEPVIDVIELDNRLKQATMKLPSTLTPSGAGKYIPVAWSENERLLLVEFRQASASRWFVIDTRDVSRSVDVNAIAGGEASLRNIMFAHDSDRVLYALNDDALHRLDIANRTMSEPLVKDVAHYWQSNDGVMSYVTNYDAKAKTRTTGYYTPGASSPRVLETIKSPAKTAVAVVIGEYHGRQYIATQRGDSLSVSRVKLHPSDNQGSLEATRVGVMDLDDSPEYLSFSLHDRFIMAQNGSTYLTYDIELDKFTTTTLRGEKPLTGRLAWLDRYHVWSAHDGTLRSYEFDGENVQNYGKTVAGLPAKLSKNSEALYVFQPTINGEIELTRISLRIR